MTTPDQNPPGNNPYEQNAPNSQQNPYAQQDQQPQNPYGQQPPQIPGQGVNRPYSNQPQQPPTSGQSPPPIPPEYQQQDQNPQQAPYNQQPYGNQSQQPPQQVQHPQYPPGTVPNSQQPGYQQQGFDIRQSKYYSQAHGGIAIGSGRPGTQAYEDKNKKRARNALLMILGGVGCFGVLCVTCILLFVGFISSTTGEIPPDEIIEGKYVIKEYRDHMKSSGHLKENELIQFLYAEEFDFADAYVAVTNKNLIVYNYFNNQDEIIPVHQIKEVVLNPSPDGWTYPQCMVTKHDGTVILFSLPIYGDMNDDFVNEIRTRANI